MFKQIINNVKNSGFAEKHKDKVHFFLLEVFRDLSP